MISGFFYNLCIVPQYSNPFLIFGFGFLTYILGYLLNLPHFFRPDISPEYGLRPESVDFNQQLPESAVKP